MGIEVGEVESIVRSTPSLTSSEIRDALRAYGRVSMTVADVERILRGRPYRFRADPGSPTRWSYTESSESSLPGEVSGGMRPLSPLPPVPESAGDPSGVVLSGPSPAPALPELYRWQREALSRWNAKGNRGVVEAVTGTGKTMLGVAATLAELRAGGQVVVVVPTKDLMVQWHAVLRRYLPKAVAIGVLGDGNRGDLGHDDVVVVIVNSARAADLRPRRPGGLLIADECHRYGSAGNRLALATSFPHRLGLSATYARDDDGHVSWLDPYFGGTIFRMGYAEAINDGVLARFRVALVGVQFRVDERAEYEELSLAMSTARAKLIASGAVPAEPIGVFMEAVARLARGGSSGDGSGEGGGALARGYLAAMQNRRRLMAETPAKIEVLIGLVPAVLRADRAIIFAQTISGATRTAEVLRGEGVEVDAMHSGQSSSERKAILRQFESGVLRAVVAPQLLDEGVDVPAADLAIVLAASRSRRQMIQRMGRVLRRKSDGRIARLVVVFVEGTVEDPALGAHDLFLDEVTEAAESVLTFRSATTEPGSLLDISAFVNGMGGN